MDWLGWVLLGIAAAVFTTALPRGPAENSPVRRRLRAKPWFSFCIVAVLVLGGGALVLLANSGARTTAPVVPLGPLKPQKLGCPPIASQQVPTASPPFGIYLTQDEDVTHTIYGVDLTNGHVRWRTRIGASPHSWVRGAGKIFITTGTEVHAIDSLTGYERWHAPYGRPLRVASNVLYAVHDSELLAINAETGSVLWSEPSTVDLPGSVAIDGPLLLTAETSAVVVRARADGHKIWSYPFPRAPTGGLQHETSVGFIGSRVFVADETMLVSIDAALERACWQRHISLGDCFVPAESDVLVLSDSSNKITVLDAASGRFVWQTHLANALCLAATLRVLDFIRVARSDSLVAVDRRTGTRRWAAAISGLSDTAVVPGGVVGVEKNSAGTAGRLIYIDLTGRIRWSAPVGASADAIPFFVFRYGDLVICTDELAVTRAFEIKSGHLRWMFRPNTPGHFATWPGWD